MTTHTIEAWLDDPSNRDPDRRDRWLGAGRGFGPSLIERLEAMSHERISPHRQFSIRMALNSFRDLEDGAWFPFVWQPHERVTSAAQLAALPASTTAVDIAPAKDTADFSGYAAGVTRLAHLESIRVSRGHPADLDFVRGHPTLVSLDLIGKAGSALDFAAVATLVSLRQLRSGAGAPRHAEAIAAVPVLESLALQDAPPGFAYLEGLKRLAFLKLTTFSDKDASAAFALRELLAIKLEYGSQLASLGAVSGARGALSEVTLAFCKLLKDCSGLGHASGLTSLTLRNLPNLEDVSWLASLKKLVRLRIQKCPKLQATAVIAKMPQLEELIYDDMPKVESLAFLGGLKKLRRLSLVAVRFDDRSYEPLYPLRQLRTLDLVNLKPDAVDELRRHLPTTIVGGRDPVEPA